MFFGRKRYFHNQLVQPQSNRDYGDPRPKEKKKKKKPKKDQDLDLKKLKSMFGNDIIIQLLLKLFGQKEKKEKEPKKDRKVRGMRRAGGGGFQSKSSLATERKRKDAEIKRSGATAKIGNLITEKPREGESQDDFKKRQLKDLFTEVSKLSADSDAGLGGNLGVFALAALNSEGGTRFPAGTPEEFKPIIGRLSILRRDLQREGITPEQTEKVEKDIVRVVRTMGLNVSEYFIDKSKDTGVKVGVEKQTGRSKTIFGEGIVGGLGGEEELSSDDDDLPPEGGGAKVKKKKQTFKGSAEAKAQAKADKDAKTKAQEQAARTTGNIAAALGISGEPLSAVMKKAQQDQLRREEEKAARVRPPQPAGEPPPETVAEAQEFLAKQQEQLSATLDSVLGGIGGGEESIEVTVKDVEEEEEEDIPLTQEQLELQEADLTTRDIKKLKKKKATTREQFLEQARDKITELTTDIDDSDYSDLYKTKLEEQFREYEGLEDFTRPKQKLNKLDTIKKQYEGKKLKEPKVQGKPSQFRVQETDPYRQAGTEIGQGRGILVDKDTGDTLIDFTENLTLKRLQDELEATAPQSKEAKKLRKDWNVTFRDLANSWKRENYPSSFSGEDLPPAGYGLDEGRNLIEPEEIESSSFIDYTDPDVFNRFGVKLNTDFITGGTLQLQPGETVEGIGIKGMSILSSDGITYRYIPHEKLSVADENRLSDDDRQKREDLISLASKNPKQSKRVKELREGLIQRQLKGIDESVDSLLIGDGTSVETQPAPLEVAAPTISLTSYIAEEKQQQQDLDTGGPTIEEITSSDEEDIPDLETSVETAPAPSLASSEEKPQYEPAPAPAPEPSIKYEPEPQQEAQVVDSAYGLGASIETVQQEDIEEDERQTQEAIKLSLQEEPKSYKPVGGVKQTKVEKKFQLEPKGLEGLDTSVDSLLIGDGTSETAQEEPAPAPEPKINYEPEPQQDAQVVDSAYGLGASIETVQEEEAKEEEDRLARLREERDRPLNEFSEALEARFPGAGRGELKKYKDARSDMISTEDRIRRRERAIADGDSYIPDKDAEEVYREAEKLLDDVGILPENLRGKYPEETASSTSSESDVELFTPALKAEAEPKPDKPPSPEPDAPAVPVADESVEIALSDIDLPEAEEEIDTPTNILAETLAGLDDIPEKFKAPRGPRFKFALGLFDKQFEIYKRATDTYKEKFLVSLIDSGIFKSEEKGGDRLNKKKKDAADNKFGEEIVEVSLDNQRRLKALQDAELQKQVARQETEPAVKPTTVLQSVLQQQQEEEKRAVLEAQSIKDADTRLLEERKREAEEEQAKIEAAQLGRKASLAQIDPEAGIPSAPPTPQQSGVPPKKLSKKEQAKLKRAAKTPEQLQEEAKSIQQQQQIVAYQTQVESAGNLGAEPDFFGDGGMFDILVGSAGTSVTQKQLEGQRKKQEGRSDEDIKQLQDLYKKEKAKGREDDDIFGDDEFSQQIGATESIIGKGTGSVGTGKSGGTAIMGELQTIRPGKKLQSLIKGETFTPEIKPPESVVSEYDLEVAGLGGLPSSQVYTEKGELKPALQGQGVKSLKSLEAEKKKLLGELGPKPTEAKKQQIYSKALSIFKEAQSIADTQRAEFWKDFLLDYETGLREEGQSTEREIQEKIFDRELELEQQDLATEVSLVQDLKVQELEDKARLAEVKEERKKAPKGPEREKLQLELEKLESSVQGRRVTGSFRDTGTVKYHNRPGFSDYLTTQKKFFRANPRGEDELSVSSGIQGPPSIDVNETGRGALVDTIGATPVTAEQQRVNLGLQETPTQTAPENISLLQFQRDQERQQSRVIGEAPRYGPPKLVGGTIKYPDPQTFIQAQSQQYLEDKENRRLQGIEQRKLEEQELQQFIQKEEPRRLRELEDKQKSKPPLELELQEVPKQPAIQDKPFDSEAQFSQFQLEDKPPSEDSILEGTYELEASYEDVEGGLD